MTLNDQLNAVVGCRLQQGGGLGGELLSKRFKANKKEFLQREQRGVAGMSPCFDFFLKDPWPDTLV